MKRILVSILLLFVLLNSAFAQTANMDSMVSKIVTTLNVDTVTPRKYTQIANKLASNGYYREALSLIGKAVKMDPKYYLSKAVIAFNAGLMDEAIMDINKYITFQKRNFDGYYFRGWCYDNLRKYDEAIKDYSQAIKFNSSYPYAYLGRANMYRVINEWQKAKKDYQKVISLEPVPNANSCMQYAYLFLGQKDKAKRIMDAILTIYDTPGNNYDAACLYSDMNEKDSALYYLERALKKGYKIIAHIMQDDDLDNIHRDQRYTTMMQKYLHLQKHNNTPEEIILSILRKTDDVHDYLDKLKDNDTTSTGKLILFIKKKYHRDTNEELLSRMNDYNKSHTKPDIKYAQMLQDISKNFEYRGFDKEAIKYMNGYLKLRNSLCGLDSAYAYNLSYLGFYYTKIGNYRNAIKCEKEVSSIYKNHFGEKCMKYARSLKTQAYYYQTISNFKKAIELNKHALSIISSFSKDNIDYAKELSSIAENYYCLDDYKNAIKYELQSLKIREPHKEDWLWSYGNSVSNMAFYYSCLGEYKKAIIWDNLSVKVNPFNFKKDSSLHANDHNMAYYYSMLGNYKKSKELEILNLRKYKDGNTNRYPMLLNSLSYCCYKLGEKQKAVELCQLAKDIIETNHNKNMSIYTSILNNLAWYDFSFGKYEEGLTLEEKNKDLIKTICGNKSHQYINALLKLASYHQIVGNDKKACSYVLDFSTLIRQYVRDNFLWLTSDERKTFWNMYNSALTNMIPHLTFQLQNNSLYGACYDAAIFYKGILLSTQTEFKKIVMGSGNQQLIKDYSELEKNKATLMHLYDTSTSSMPLDADSLETICNTKERAIVETSSLYGDFTKNITYRWLDVQKSLKSNDVAIEFANFPLDNDSIEYAAMVLRKDMKCPKMIDLCLEPELLKHQKNGTRMYDGYENKAVYALVWNKLEPYLHEGDNVYFSPSGLFYQMNIEALKDSTGKMANEKYHLYRVSSTKELCYQNAASKIKTATLYGGLVYDMDSTTICNESRKYHLNDKDYMAYRGCLPDSISRGAWAQLPQTGREVDMIANELKNVSVETNVMKGINGTEESFKSLSGKNISVIHLATHGFFLKDEEVSNKKFFENIMQNTGSHHQTDTSMKRSGLIFSGGQKAWLGGSLPDNVEDGILLAEEIPTIDLRGTDLLVLSACDTGLGEVNSEGVFGLQRGFKQAGVKTIVMSLWKVSDNATALFMSQFYKNLTDGQTKQQAFINAQKTLRNSNDFSDPKYWAAFIMLDAI